MTNKVIDFPLHDVSLTPEQTLAAGVKKRWKRVLVLGILDEGKNGTAHVIASNMSNEQALWLATWAQRLSLREEDI